MDRLLATNVQAQCLVLLRIVDLCNIACGSIYESGK